MPRSPPEVGVGKLAEYCSTICLKDNLMLFEITYNCNYAKVELLNDIWELKIDPNLHTAGAAT